MTVIGGGGGGGGRGSSSIGGVAAGRSTRGVGVGSWGRNLSLQKHSDMGAAAWRVPLDLIGPQCVELTADLRVLKHPNLHRCARDR